MKGKEKCKALKEIRRQIAEANDIEYAVSECKHQGDCLGTCPKCESELRYLERELAVRQSLGKAVAVVGLSAGVCATMTACNASDILKNPFGQEELAGAMVAPEELEGDVALPAPSEIPENTETTDGCEIEGNIVEPETQWEIAGDITLTPSEEASEE